MPTKRLSAAANPPSSDSSDEISDTDFPHSPRKPTDSDEDPASDEETEHYERETPDNPLNPSKPTDSDEGSSSGDEREDEEREETPFEPLNPSKPTGSSGEDGGSTSEEEEREAPTKPSDSPKPTGKRVASKPATEQKKIVWTEDAEVAVVKGLCGFRAKTGVDPYKDRGAFFDYVKKLVPFEVTRKQLMDKLLRLKMKFEKNGMVEGKLLDASRLVWGTSGKRKAECVGVEEGSAEKSSKKANKETPLSVGGEDLVTKASNGEKSHKKAKRETALSVGGEDLVKKEGNGENSRNKAKKEKALSVGKDKGKGAAVGVEEGSVERVCNDENSSKKAKREKALNVGKENGKSIVVGVEEGSVERECNGEKSSKKARKDKPLAVTVENGERIVVDKAVSDEIVGFWDKYPHLKEALVVENFGSFSKDGKTNMVKVLGKIGDEIAKELEDGWKRFQTKEAELKLMKLDLIRKQTKVVIEKLMHQP